MEFKFWLENIQKNENDAEDEVRWSNNQDEGLVLEY